MGFSVSVSLRFASSRAKNMLPSFVRPYLTRYNQSIRALSVEPNVQNVQLRSVNVLVHFFLGSELRVRWCSTMQLGRLHDDADTGRRRGLSGLLHERKQTHDKDMVTEVVDLKVS